MTTLNIIKWDRPDWEGAAVKVSPKHLSLGMRLGIDGSDWGGVLVYGKDIACRLYWVHHDYKLNIITKKSESVKTIKWTYWHSFAHDQPSTVSNMSSISTFWEWNRQLRLRGSVKISEVVSLSNLNNYSSLFSLHSTLVAFGLFFMYMGMNLCSDTWSLILFIIQLVVWDSASVLLPEHWTTLCLDFNNLRPRRMETCPRMNQAYNRGPEWP